MEKNDTEKTLDLLNSIQNPDEFQDKIEEYGEEVEPSTPEEQLRILWDNDELAPGDRLTLELEGRTFEIYAEPWKSCCFTDEELEEAKKADMDTDHYLQTEVVPRRLHGDRDHNGIIQSDDWDDALLVDRCHDAPYGVSILYREVDDQ